MIAGALLGLAASFFGNDFSGLLTWVAGIVVVLLLTLAVMLRHAPQVYYENFRLAVAAAEKIAESAELAEHRINGAVRFHILQIRALLGDGRPNQQIVVALRVLNGSPFDLTIRIQRPRLLVGAGHDLLHEIIETQTIKEMVIPRGSYDDLSDLIFPIINEAQLAQLEKYAEGAEWVAGGVKIDLLVFRGSAIVARNEGTCGQYVIRIIR